jgi:opacity protein-like surface antigen
MKRVSLLLALLCATAASATAQDAYPKVEVFGGYSYFNADPIHGDNGRDRKGANGLAFSFAGNLNSKLGLVAEVSGHHGSLELGNGRDWNTYTFLGGPRFSLRGNRVTGFGHFLLGAMKSDIELYLRNNDFALAAGGGFDLTASKRLAVRIVQVDYIPVHNSGRREWANTFRVQTGIVFRWGNR